MDAGEEGTRMIDLNDWLKSWDAYYYTPAQTLSDGDVT